MNNKPKVRENQIKQLKMAQPEPPISRHHTVILNKDKFVEALDETLESKTIALLRSRMSGVKQIIANPKNDKVGIVNIDANGDTVSVRKDVMLSDIEQILEAQTMERAQYYLRRLRAGINEIKTGKVNEINLRRWKEYDEVLTDSLWVLQKRDNSGAHVAEYWGNFIPQIPRQMMVRYTKKGDWVLDAFAGSGTTLIECRRLGRNGIGIELNPQVAQRARELVEQEQNRGNATTDVVVGDNRTIDIQVVLARHNIDRVQLLMMHPPYHDITRSDLEMEKSELEILGDEYRLRPTFDIVDCVGGVHGFDVFDEDENLIAHYDVDNETEVELQIKWDFHKVSI